MVSALERPRASGESDTDPLSAKGGQLGTKEVAVTRDVTEDAFPLVLLFCSSRHSREWWAWSGSGCGSLLEEGPGKGGEEKAEGRWGRGWGAACPFVGSRSGIHTLAAPWSYLGSFFSKSQCPGPIWIHEIRISRGWALSISTF